MFLTGENLEQEVEDEETLAKILEKQANDESVVDADGNLVGESKTAEVPANLGGEQIFHRYVD